jgi:hypothetical protein
MDENQIRAELEAVRAALRNVTADTADLQARTHRVSSGLVVLVGQSRNRMASKHERDLRALIALWAEIKTALEARTTLVADFCFSSTSEGANRGMRYATNGHHSA